jgi:hypothetical protein
LEERVSFGGAGLEFWVGLSGNVVGMNTFLQFNEFNKFCSDYGIDWDEEII